MVSSALLRDARDLVALLARRMPERAAVAWVHAAGMVAHARRLELVDDAGGVELGLVRLAAAHPSLSGLTDPAVTPLWQHPLDVVEREALDRLWRAHPLLPDSPAGPPDGHSVGELYQALSAEARKARALCQTPPFVGELLLQLAVDPALEEFGRSGLRVIDPSCGTGHLLVAALLHLSAGRPAAQHLEAVHGVDLDPYAAAIAAYRLLALTCRAGDARGRLATARDLPVQVAAADALLAADEPLLQRGRYHAVVGNPPYVTVKDPLVNAAVRAAYPSVCSGKYSLALPFFQLMTELLVPGGWCAQLTANSFMKREFGRKFVEDYLPDLDLQWVIDTSGAYIPGHGTPTVILVHRNQPPSTPTVRTILGKRGEPGVPADPAQGLVWSAIRDAVQQTLRTGRSR